jgi:hypothetical protein
MKPTADRRNDGAPQLRAPFKVVPPHYKHPRSPSTKAAPLRRDATSTRRYCPDQQTELRVFGWNGAGYPRRPSTRNGNTFRRRHVGAERTGKDIFLQNPTTTTTTRRYVA